MVAEVADADVGLSVAAVAQRLGVAPATLRTWDRRYGLGPSDHRPGSHRRYTPDDVVRLEYMHRLLVTGASAAEAARAARALDLEAAAAQAVDAGPVAGTDARRGGGQVLAMPGGSDAQRGLAHAAQALDYPACVEILQASLNDRGVVWTWDNLMRPVLSAVGQKWDSTGRNVEVEHALSGAIQHTFASFALAHVSRSAAGIALLASVPNEQHSLPLDAVAAGLAERRVPSRVLGSNLPAQALNDAIRKLRPCVIFLWSQSAATADTDLLRDLPRFRHRAAVIVGGPGWHQPRIELPEHVELVSDLSDAIDRITRGAGG
jgi:DNA-binding transcriptional MerR regulator